MNIEKIVCQIQVHNHFPVYNEEENIYTLEKN